MRWDDIFPLLHSCLGPRGRPKLLSPSSVISSSSKRLLPLLKSSSPFARIVLKAARTRLFSFEDGGLSCAVLAFWLASHPPTIQPLPLVGSLYEHFSAEFLHILETEVAFEADFGELHHLRCIVRTLLSSKPACSLSRGDSEVVCSLLLRSFLEAVPNGVGMTSVLGLAPSHSRIVKGITLPLREGDEERLRCMLPVGDGPFRACLFARSLAGDMDWPADVLTTTSKDAGVEAVLQHLASVVDKVVEDGVQVFLCQKVVHPRLQKRLHHARVLVLDRIGGESATRIQRIWGASSCDVCYGTLSRPSVECVGRSRLLVLNSPHLCSLVITHHNQESLSELEVVCRQSLCALFRLLQRPRVCFGGGCSEITAAVFLAKKVRGCLDSICSETNRNPGQVMYSLESFVRGITHLCSFVHQGTPMDFSTDSESGHLWRPPTNKCACGSRDASSVKSSAWRQLTDIAGLGDILDASSVEPSLLASDIPSVSQNSTEPRHVPQTLSTLMPQNASASVPQTMQTSMVPQNATSVSQTMQTSHLVSQNVLTSLPQTIQASPLVPQNASTSVLQTNVPHRVINPSKADSTGQDILLDEFGCKLSSLSVAFEMSSMLLKTTECIHTSPRATMEDSKGDVLS